MQKKICSYCKEEKPLECFSLSKKNNDGHLYGCKSCFSKIKKSIYNADNRRDSFHRSKKNCPRCGAKMSPQSKRCMSCLSEDRKNGKIITGRPFKTGKDHPNWKEGYVAKIRELIDNSRKYKLWRSKIYERDNWTCQTCGRRGSHIEAHHIYPFSKIIYDYHISTIEDANKCNKLWELDNGVTLCKECHRMTDNYGGRWNK